MFTLLWTLGQAVAQEQFDCANTARQLAALPDYSARAALLTSLSAQEASTTTELGRLRVVLTQSDIAEVQDPEALAALFLTACAPAPQPSPAEAAPAAPEPESAQPSSLPGVMLTPEQAQQRYEAERLVRDGFTITVNYRINPAWMKRPPPEPSWTVTMGGKDVSAAEFARRTGDQAGQKDIFAAQKRQRAATRALFTVGVLSGLSTPGLLLNEDTRPVGAFTLALSALSLSTGAGLTLQRPMLEHGPVSHFYTEAEADVLIEAYNQHLRRELGMLD